VPGFRRGGSDQEFQAIAEALHRGMEGHGRDLREDRRDLDRDHLDVGVLEGGEVALEAPLGLGFSEERLAEKVHVHADAFRPARAQVRGQKLRLRREHHVGRLLVHLLLCERDGHAGQVTAEGLEAPQQRAVERGEETRYALDVEDVGELVCCAAGGARAKRLVRHLNQRGLVGGVLDHAIEFGLLATFLRRLECQCAFLDPPCEPHGRADQSRLVVGPR